MFGQEYGYFGLLSKEEIMGFFTKSSEKETRERVKWATEHSGEAADAIKAYKKGKADRESVRRELARHDDYFRYVDED